MKPYVGYGVLLVVAYSGLLTYKIMSAPHAPAVAAAMVPPAIRQAAVTRDIPAPQSGAQLQTTAEAAPAQSAAAATLLAPQQTVPDHSQPMHDDLNSLTVQASDATLAAPARRTAIAKLGMRQATPETMQALQTALTADTEVANRVQAINALSRLSYSHKEVSSDVQRMLDLASQDTEPSVARAARSASEKMAARGQ